MESEVKSVAEATDTAKAEISAVVAEQKPRDEEVRREYSFKTALGKSVAAGEIKDIDEILNKNLKILEPGIVDYLLPGLQTDFLYVGQSKGKFGGGKRRIIRNTQKISCRYVLKTDIPAVFCQFLSICAGYRLITFGIVLDELCYYLMISLSDDQTR